MNSSNIFSSLKAVLPILVASHYQIISKSEISNYYELIGRNTEYTCHPDETMADNFDYTVKALDDQVKEPWILKSIREILW